MASIRDIFTEKRYIRLCRSITKGTDLADDLLQHCAIMIHEKGVCDDPRSQFTLFSYFKRTAVNAWNNPGSKFNQLYRRNPTLPIDQQISTSLVDDEKSDFRKFVDRHISRDTSYKQSLIDKAEARAKESTIRSLKIRDQLLKNAQSTEEINEINEAHSIRIKKIQDTLDKAIKPQEDFFLNEIFLLFLKLGSTYKVEAATGIDRRVISKSIKIYKQQIEDEYRKINNH